MSAEASDTNTIKQSFYFDFNLFKHNAQFIKLNYMPSKAVHQNGL